MAPGRGCRGSGSITPPACGYESPGDDAHFVRQDRKSQNPISDLDSDPDPDPESAARSPLPRPASSPSSLNGMLERAANLSSHKVTIKDRIACFQWTWFTMTMYFLLPPSRAPRRSCGPKLIREKGNRRHCQCAAFPYGYLPATLLQSADFPPQSRTVPLG